MSKEAIKLALDALELSSVTVDSFGVQCKTREAITALREALAEQPAQDDPDLQDKDPELVEQPAQQRHISYACSQCHWSLEEQPAQQQEPVISTAHGPWIPSTHPGEEGESYCKRCLLRDKFLGSRQCEPHIVEQPVQKQEPDLSMREPSAIRDRLIQAGWTPPAQRTWVGLTNDEIAAMKTLHGANRERTAIEMAFAVQAKLKEKNNGN